MKKFVSFILIMIFALSFMAISVNAQCTLSVTSSKKEVYVGEEFKIYLTFSGSESIESADGSVEFDNSKSNNPIFIPPFLGLKLLFLILLYHICY